MSAAVMSAAVTLTAFHGFPPSIYPTVDSAADPLSALYLNKAAAMFHMKHPRKSPSNFVDKSHHLNPGTQSVRPTDGLTIRTTVKR